MSAAQNNSDNKLTIPEKINEFFQKNRKPIIIGFAGILVIIAGLIIGITVKDKMVEKALGRVDEFSRRYNELNNYTDENEITRLTEMTILLAELDSFAKKSFGFPAARAYSISADILMDQKNWTEAERAYLAAANKAGKSYFAPVCLFNAAVAAEEQDNIESAIAHYKKSLDFSFPAAARSQFSIGRLEESRNNKNEALEAYNTVMAKWPGEQLWANLAQSRIIALSD